MLLGDVISMSMTAVVVQVEGKELSYPRNQVKKLMLVERVIQQNPPHGSARGLEFEVIQAI